MTTISLSSTGKNPNANPSVLMAIAGGTTALAAISAEACESAHSGSRRHGLLSTDSEIWHRWGDDEMPYSVDRIAEILSVAEPERFAP